MARTYDVFLCHNGKDKPAVLELAFKLREKSIEPWLDKAELPGGTHWLNQAAEALAACRSCAFFVGPNGLGQWQEPEVQIAVERHVKEGHFPVIPVLLPGADEKCLPKYLNGYTWVAFGQSLDNEEAVHRLACYIRGIAPGLGQGKLAGENECPYRGLEFFDVAHAPYFYGREELTARLVEKLRPSSQHKASNRFLAIVGASGSGKSSLARAGLVAALKRGAIEGSDKWPVVICRPGSDPCASLAVELARLGGLDLEKQSAFRDRLKDRMQREQTALDEDVRQVLSSGDSKQRLVILIDQFEELFTICRDEKLRQAFVDNLVYASQVPQDQTLVLLAMRADFYGKCATYIKLARALSECQELIGPMTRDELQEAIEKPAQKVGCELEPGLVDLLLNDVVNDPGSLPFLQFALKELWNRKTGRKLTTEAYRGIGGVTGALQRKADEVYSHLSEPQQRICRRIFLRLTQPGEGTEDTKRRVSISELKPEAGSLAEVEAVLLDLSEAETRLITGEAEDGEEFFEVAHEALIRGWPELRKWIDADRQALLTQRRLTEAANEWSKKNRDASFLYAGARLAAAQEWASSNAEELSSLELEYIRACRQRQAWGAATEIIMPMSEFIGSLARGASALVFGAASIGGAVVRRALSRRSLNSADRELRTEAATFDSEPEPNDRVGVAAESVPAALPICITDNVQFTVFRPRVIPPLQWHALLAFVHLAELQPDAGPDAPQPLEEVERQAKQVLGAAFQSYGKAIQDSTTAVPRKEWISFIPDMEGIEFNPSRQEVQWVENVHKVEFRFRASPEMDGKTARGRMTVYLGSLILADIPLQIRVDNRANVSESKPNERAVGRPYHNIFASYSHADTPIVEQFEQYAKGLGDRYLRDAVHLRAGQVWNDELKRLIDQADVFQLFWSRNSMRSEFVRQEWEYALSLRRSEFVRPTYWENPFPENPEAGLPPDHLRRLHFQYIGMLPNSRDFPTSKANVGDRENVPDPETAAQAQEKGLLDEMLDLMPASVPLELQRGAMEHSPERQLPAVVEREPLQHRLERVRKPRVHITYDVEIGDAVAVKELPFVVGVMGDFTGNPTQPLKPLQDRKFVSIDRDNFNDVMAQLAPGLKFKVPNTLKGDGSEMSVQLKFSSMDDFEPARIVEQVELLKVLLEARNKLRDLLSATDRSPKLETELERILQNSEEQKKFADEVGTSSSASIDVRSITEGRPWKQEQVNPQTADKETEKGLLDQTLDMMPAVVQRDVGRDLIQSLVDQATQGRVVWDQSVTRTINKAIEQLDQALSKQLAAVMHQPDFLKLEGTWRGLQFFVINSETSALLKLRLLNLSKRELFKDLDKAIEFDQSQIFKKIYEDVYGSPGGEPYGALIADYEFTNHPEDIDLLQKMGGVAGAAFAPFIAAAAPSLMGLSSYAELSQPRDLEKIFLSKDYIKWNAFRDSEDSRFICLTMPRALARLPYGVGTKPIEEFGYEEAELDETGRSREMAHDNYCWMNAAYVMGSRLTDSFARHAWCTAIRGVENGGMVEGLPLHIFKTMDGDLDLNCPTEIGITDRREAELSKLGFLPLCHNKNTDFSVFYGGQMCQRPKKYDTTDATANAIIVARLPYNMAASRIAHYLKCIARDKIGSFQERDIMEDWLNRWIKRYVILDDKPSADLKAKYPLADAQVEVTEIPGKPREYNAVAWLRPWLQLEALTTSLRIVVVLPSRA